MDGDLISQPLPVKNGKPAADAATYARVFEGHADGALVLEDLIARFGGALFVKGGEEGRRETDFRLGRRSVLDYILGQINRASDVEPPDEDVPA